MHSLHYTTLINCLWTPAQRSSSEVHVIFANVLLPAIRSLEWRARYVFYCMFFCVFFSLLCQRFLDNPRAYSSQILHAGVVWFRMYSPLLGVGGPGGWKMGKWNFRYYRSQWGILAFWWFLSDISATRGRIHTKFHTCRDNVHRRAPSPSRVHRPLGGAGGGGVKTQKMEGGLIRA